LVAVSVKSPLPEEKKVLVADGVVPLNQNSTVKSVSEVILKLLPSKVKYWLVPSKSKASLPGDNSHVALAVMFLPATSSSTSVPSPSSIGQ